jgi:hypothetical protein
MMGKRANKKNKNNNHLRLWVDDLRDPDKNGAVGWSWAKTYDEAIRCLQLGEVLEISLDHDLGDWEEDWNGKLSERSGYDIAIWMAENDVWPPDGAGCHSANPVGWMRIQGVIDRYGPYERILRGK